MKKQLENRLQSLQKEFEKGQQKLEELEVESGNLRQTILRISGAIQVLKEELEKFEEVKKSDLKPIINNQEIKVN